MMRFLSPFNLHFQCCCVRYLLVLLVFVASSLQAKSLVSIATEPMVAVPNHDDISRVVVVGGQPIALGDNFTWVLDKTETRWQPNDWHPQGRVAAVAADGDQAFLLLDAEQSGFITHVEKILLPSETLSSSSLPPLPVPLGSAQGALLFDQLFVVGKSADNITHMFALDLNTAPMQWAIYDAWPGNMGSVTSVVAQNTSLLVTVANTEGAGERMLQWTLKEGWKERSALAGTVIEGTGRAIGQGHVLYLVVNNVVNDAENVLKTTLMSFHTITGSWAIHGELDAGAARFGTGWKEGILWLSAKKTAEKSEFFLTKINSGKQLLAPLDWTVIAVYLTGMLGIGLYFYRRHAQDSEAEFFLGGRSIPFWAAGISLYVTNASSISYIAVPAKAFATNWQYLLSNLIVVVGLLFVAVWVVPMLRRLNLMSSFHYLETRFHPSIRVLSSALYIVFQLCGRMSIILFLPALAISTVTGIDVVLSILVMGGVTIIYTVLGGMKAVIWTDFVQLFVMFGGTFFAIAIAITMLDGGVDEFIATSLADGKMKLIDWRFDLTEATIWGFIFLVLFDTILTFPKDQVLMQRILSTESPKQANRSVWTFALIVLPASVLFYVIGTALYVFYQRHPERMDPSLSIDATFPLFIAAELPVGITGLIIAGIFAASMSTLSSILNSVATLTTVDFYEKIVTHSNNKSRVRFAERVTVIAGLIGVGLAVLLSRYEIDSLLDLALELWGLLGGGFAGAYTLGMFTRRANWQGVAIGVTVSIVVTLVAWSVNWVHPYFYLPLSVLICIVVGYAASWLYPPPSTLDGLTVYSQKKEDIAKLPTSS
jgi:solute:Na+ symporter, SSS family